MKNKIVLLLLSSFFLFACSNKNEQMGSHQLSSMKENDYLSTTNTLTNPNIQSDSRRKSQKTFQARPATRPLSPSMKVAKSFFEYEPYNYSYDLGSDFNIRDELYQIRHGDISSPVLMLLMFQNTELSDVGYKLCLASGRPEEQCFYSLGGVNLGYGLCMAAHRNPEECKLAKGENNVGFGICMGSRFGNKDLCSKALRGNNLGFALCVASEYTQNRNVDCLNALGGENTGYGLCLAAGRYESECRAALGKPNVGFGLCVAEFQNTPSDCAKALSYNVDSLGYGLCMASGHELKEVCEKALGRTELGYGICMSSTRSDNASECAQALNRPSIGFGICMASGRYEEECDNVLDDYGINDNIGSGICMAAVMPDGTGLSRHTCEKFNGSDNTGAGLCMAAGRDPGTYYTYSDGTKNYDANYDNYDSYCKGAKHNDNTGFGLCMLNIKYKDYHDCNNLIGNTNIGAGLCMLSGGSESDCYDALNSPSLGYGICMNAGRSENNCDEGLNGYNIGFGLCMTEYKNETLLCSDLREADLGNLKSDFLLSINNGPTKSIKNETVNSTTPLRIDLALTPNYQDLHKKADIYVVAAITGEDNKTSFYQKNGAGFYPWDYASGISTLIPASTDVELKGTMTSTIYDGKLTNIKGKIQLYHGYKLKSPTNSPLIYNNNNDFSFTVNQ